MYKKEIERKFLVNKDNMPDLLKYSYIEIKQGYLSQPNDNLSVRVRSFDDEKYSLDMKDGKGLVRDELTLYITKEQFEETFPICGERIIVKKRYFVPSKKNNDKILEVDVYRDFDFITCEYEGENEEDVEILIWEDWFMEELTNKPEYSNRSLAYSRIN
jgi:CYTH domain-containing protein